MSSPPEHRRARRRDARGGNAPVAGVEALTDTLDAVARPVHGEIEDAITGESATTLHDISYLTDGRPFDGRRVVVPVSGVAP